MEEGGLSIRHLFAQVVTCKAVFVRAFGNLFLIKIIKQFKMLENAKCPKND